MPSAVRAAAISLSDTAPLLFAADGSRMEIDVCNQSPEEIAAVVQRVRDASTGVVRRLSKPVTTHRPSIQGVWDPSVEYDGFKVREAKVPAPAPVQTTGATA